MCLRRHDACLPWPEDCTPRPLFRGLQPVIDVAHVLRPGRKCRKLCFARVGASSTNRLRSRGRSKVRNGP
ncbi:hypothetical protein AERO9AM_20420 [Aeromicrobium sp. 9AM]|nr:hypothetical protein AERO9AM_20420 [Aeromicrobium sp. 9AM]